MADDLEYDPRKDPELRKALRSWKWTKFKMRFQKTKLPCGCTKSFGKTVLTVMGCPEHFPWPKDSGGLSDEQVVTRTEPEYGDGDANGEENT